MNVNKKFFIIAISAGAALILIILIAIIVLGNKKEIRQSTYTRNVINNTSTTPTNDVENTIEEEEDPREKIEGEITYVETSDGHTIPVPPTFSYVEGEYERGAIIEDQAGNQFVWVPVEDYNTYTRQFFVNNGEGNDINSNATLEDYSLKDILSYNPDYDDSIKNYKGFYIARYEAGKEKIEGINYAISKPDVLPWTQITWSNAKAAAENMYIENDYFSSDLVNSYAWDTICNWLEDTGTNIDDSVEYGNYQNSANGVNMVTKTAANNRWQTNNIFDMAGNAWEYTTEESGSHDIKHVGRGGGYWNEGDKYPISSRGITADGSNLDIGFRVVLYFK